MFTGRAMGYDNAVPFSLLTIVRKYEYFAFALIGIYIAGHTEGADKAALEEFTWMSGFHILIGLLQVAGACNYAVIGFLDYWDPSWANRAISTFNGHYEYGHFLCFGIVICLAGLIPLVLLKRYFSPMMVLWFGSHWGKLFFSIIYCFYYIALFPAILKLLQKKEP